MDKRELTERVKRKAVELGYVRAGVTTPDAFPEWQHALESRDGYESLMRDGHDSPLYKGGEPLRKVPQAKSIISLVYSYGHIDFPERLLKYVGRAYLGRCYGAPDDTVNGQRKVLFEDYLHSLGINTFDEPGFLQVPDRAVAARAGLVEFGKNNFAFAGEYGSFIIMTSIVTDADLETEVHETRRACPPDCDKCVHACPTHAMHADGQLIAQRCVLNNNMKPDEMLVPKVQDLLGVRIHGCDECQTVCPLNAQALAQPKVKDPLLERLADELRLEDLLFMTGEYYERTIRPIMYNYIRDPELFKRNAALAMGNSGDVSYIPALQRAAAEGSDMVKVQAVRALEKLEALQ